jgi:hypothetical protein
MKFSAKTQQVIRNFASINNGIQFKQGNVLKTMSESKNVMAKATLDTEVEATFCIHDLSQFLGAVSMMDDPDLTPTDHYLQIGKGSEKFNYIYADPSMILIPPDKDIALPTRDVEFKLNGDVLTRVMKALGVLGSPQIAVTGDREKIYLQTMNVKNPTDSSFRVEVGETTSEFNLIFLTENIRLLPGDYDVAISAKGFGHFAGDGVDYWITIEKDSSFNQ